MNSRNSRKKRVIAMAIVVVIVAVMILSAIISGIA